MAPGTDGDDEQYESAGSERAEPQLNRRKTLSLCATAAVLGAGNGAGWAVDSVSQSTASGWPQFGGTPGNTGVAPASAGIVDGGSLGWAYRSGIQQPDQIAATAAGIVVGSDEELYGIDPADGSVRWRRQSGFVTPSAVADDQRVYLAVGNEVLAVDPTDPEPIWTTEFDETGSVRGLALADGTLYVSQEPSEYYESPAIVRALDPTDGSERWRVDTEIEENYAQFEGRGRITAADGRLFITGYDVTETVYAFGTDGGEQLWTTELSGRVQTPAAVGETLVLRSGEEIYALDASDGSVLWSGTYEATLPVDPVAGDESVFVEREDKILALNPSDGSVKWRFGETFGVGTPKELSVDDGTVYLRTDESLFALDAATGDQQWSHSLGSEPATAPTIVDGTVYLGNQTEPGITSDAERLYSLVALDREGGTTRWQIEADDGIVDQPIVDDGRLVAADRTHRVQAVGTDSGQREWARVFDEQIDGGLATDGQRVFVLSEKLVALSLDGGTQAWEFDTESPTGRFETPALANGTLYVSGPTALHAVDTASGDEQWSVEFSAEGEGRPAIGENRVVAWDGGTLVGVDREGDRQWEQSIEDGAALDPTVSDGRVFVRANQGEIVGLDVADGTELWRADIGGIVGGIAVTAGRVVAVAGGEANRIACLRADTGDRLWRTDSEREFSDGDAVAVAGGVAYVPLDEGVAAFALDDGSERWAVETDRRSGAPVVARERLYLGTQNGTLRQITGEAGSIPLEELGEPVSGSGSGDGSDGSDGSTAPSNEPSDADAGADRSGLLAGLGGSLAAALAGLYALRRYSDDENER